MPASQRANYIVLCARYIMNPTFFHLLFLFAAPLIWFSGNKTARLLVLVSILALSAVNWSLATLAACGFLVALLIGQRGSFKLSSPVDLRAIAIYSLWCTMPLYTHLAWQFWPGHWLAGQEWDPARSGWLYDSLGSGSALAFSKWWMPLIGCLAISIFLFAYDRLQCIIFTSSKVEDEQ